MDANQKAAAALLAVLQTMDEFGMNAKKRNEAGRMLRELNGETKHLQYVQKRCWCTSQNG